MVSSIGIKEANGDFYSILEENSTVKKRLVLTTVHDNQKSVQIDLYRSYSKSMADAMYIGSIVVDNITLKPKGEPSIEMTITSSKNGTISAEAVDLGGGAKERQSLSVSLKSFEEDKNEYADFEMELERSSAEEDQNTYTKIQEYEERKFPLAALIIIGLVLALICAGLWFFVIRSGKIPLPFFNNGNAPATSSVQVEKTAGEAEPAAVSETPAAPETAVSAQAPPPTVTERSAEYAAAPQAIPSEGLAYKIRQGDTLWQISEAFYRNPWLYPSIVKFNKISNPNFIIIGTQITIPPKK